MRTSTFNSLTFVYPNEICFARGNNFVSVSQNNAVDTTVSLEVLGEGKRIRLIRTIRKDMTPAKVVFPLDSILETLASQTVTIEVLIGDDDSIMSSTLVVLDGASEREVLNAGESNDPEGVPFPQPALFPIYPNFLHEITLFTGLLDPNNDMEYFMQFPWTPEWLELASTPGYPFLKTETSNIDFDFAPAATSLNVVVFIGPTEIAFFRFPVFVDKCEDGMFVRWTDSRGIPCMYRFSVELSTEETTIDSEYIRLDDDLRPYRWLTKTSHTRYTLHSRKVEPRMYAYCRSVLTGRNVEYFDNTTKKWRRCIIDEGEAEDTGKPMQDLVVELVKENLILP